MTEDEFRNEAPRKIKRLGKYFSIPIKEEDIKIGEIGHGRLLAFPSHYEERVFNLETKETTLKRLPFIWIEYQEPRYDPSWMLNICYILPASPENPIYKVRMTDCRIHCMNWNMVLMLDGDVLKENDVSSLLGELFSDAEAEIQKKLLEATLSVLK